MPTNKAVDISRLKKIEKCPLCFSERFEFFEKTNQDRFHLTCVKCLDCELLYMDTQIDEKDLSDFYNGYGESRDKDDSELFQKRQKMYSQDFLFLKEFVEQKPISVLDIGGGAGTFVNFFGSNAEKTVVEIDMQSRTEGQAAFPEIVFYNTIGDVPEHARFDCIVFRGTLQYMVDLQMLRQFLNDRLNTHGVIIFLQIPNAESILAHLQRERWALFNRLEHRYYFNRRNIQILLGEKFELKKIEFPYLNTPYENYSQDFLQFLELLNDQDAEIKFPFFGSMLNAVYEKIS